MDVTYGADYSGGELSPAELDRFTTYDLRFLLRYIGWPDNPKCISHYPGAYQKLAGSGRVVLLVAQQGTADPVGGHDAGVAMAQRALDDAASVGYPDTLPIFFCAGGWLSLSGIPVDTALSYLDGAASVLGKHRIGAYGFRDFIQAAKAGGHAEWRWLCGSPPDDGELAQGWPHLYRWNGAHIYPGGRVGRTGLDLRDGDRNPGCRAAGAGGSHGHRVAHRFARRPDRRGQRDDPDPGWPDRNPGPHPGVEEGIRLGRQATGQLAGAARRAA